MPRTPYEIRDTTFLVLPSCAHERAPNLLYFFSSLYDLRREFFFLSFFLAEFEQQTFSTLMTKVFLFTTEIRYGIHASERVSTNGKSFPFLLLCCLFDHVCLCHEELAN